MRNDFFEIFQGKEKVNRSLRLLNKCNILGKYIPAFGKIVAQMQHDLFHVYTVDEHTLNVIDNIRRYSRAKLKYEFPDIVVVEFTVNTSVLSILSSPSAS